jgi:DNA repair protein RadC
MEQPENVSDYMKPLLMDKEQEEFWVLMLDTKNRLIEAKIATIGLLDRSQIHAREVFRDAIVANCSRIIVCHNHPSGNLRPSSADIDITEKAKKGLALLDILVLDHIIISEKGYYSFADEGLI